MKPSLPVALCCLLLSSFATSARVAPPAVGFVDLTVQVDAFERVVDTRPLAACRKATLPGARCLPVEDLLAPNRRLANFSGLLWLLGTAGLTGDERLLVIGDDAERRDFVAGLLFLAGQRQIAVLNVRVSGRSAFAAGGGQPRSSVREQVYRAPVRDRHLLLRSELRQLLAGDTPPVLLDGRTEEEYWGVRIRAARGGHLPGARHLASASLKRMRPELLALPEAPLVAYGGDAFEGLAYLARLIALGVDASLYLEGWSGWASDGSLPVDSLSFSRHERS